MTQPEDKRIEKLNRLYELISEDTITPKELEEFIHFLVEFIKTSKDEFESLSKENIEKLQEAVTYVGKELNDTSYLLSKEMSDLKKEFDKKCQEVLTMKPKDGAPGKAPDTTTVAIEASKIAEQRLKPFIPTAEDLSKEVSGMGEEIVDAINVLPIKPRFQIDKEHIKGLEGLEVLIARGGGGRSFFGGTAGVRTITAGDGVTVTEPKLGHFVITATGGGGGAGDVTKVGTPVDNQLAIWTGDGTVEGDERLVFTVDGNLGINIADPQRRLTVNGVGVQFANAGNGIEFLQISADTWGLYNIGTNTNFVITGDFRVNGTTIFGSDVDLGDNGLTASDIRTSNFTMEATARQGNAGGAGYNDFLLGQSYVGGGGGGAGGVGGDAGEQDGGYYSGQGADGIENVISGSAVYYGPGGCGGSTTGNDEVLSIAGFGSYGIGGSGQVADVGLSGTAGIVIVRYLTSELTATGGTITTDGASTIHTFTSNGTFEITELDDPEVEVDIEYLVVAGGGGAGFSDANISGGGGGGGGGVIGNSLVAEIRTYAVTIGAGGAGSVSDSLKGENGEDSTFGTITAIGGGGGGSRFSVDGESGGSGGGGAGSAAVTSGGIGGEGSTYPSDLEANAIFSTALVTKNNTYTYQNRSGTFAFLGSDVITQDSGVYVPISFSEVNLAAPPTMSEAMYTRLGDIVQIDGLFTTAALVTATETGFEINLEIASDIGEDYHLTGMAVCGTIAGESAQIMGGIDEDSARVRWISSNLGEQTWSYSFRYQVREAGPPPIEG
jgi:hypothetical protein